MKIVCTQKKFSALAFKVQKKFSALAFKVHSKKRYRNIDQNSQKSNDGTKNGTFLKSIKVTDNGPKKVPRYTTAMLLFRGTAQL